jgi:RHH-type proline utilization regulon transcriptional repressor/proline dehydrogenase/delta 1-pyrroline-5-carboxylate dehydrogenase
MEGRGAEPLMGIIMREAGKSRPMPSAKCARPSISCATMPNRRGHARPETHRPLGPIVCISPWNFPLAIFTGQVAAALAAGNAVLAKPAEETPLIAHERVKLLHEAGVPAARLQFTAGRGETVGAALVGASAMAGVLFTGSTEVARGRSTAALPRLSADGKPIPLIAETGGQNAHDRRFIGAARAGRGRCIALGLRQRRPALLGAARAVPAGGRRRPVLHHAEGRHGQS